MNSSLEDRTQVYRIPIRAQYAKRRKRPKNNNNFFKFVILLLIVGAMAYFFLNYLPAFNLDSSDDNKNRSQLDLSFNFSPRRQNILLMGVDVATNAKDPFKGNRTDTMLLISIAPYGKDVNVISIPRDSKVFIAGKSKADKINHAFAFGGARLAQRTVEETFGVKINNYLAISNEGVVKMIDALGGLPIYIEKNMKYDDYTAKLHINLKQGNQVLSGKEVEGYLRFRHDSFGDIGRIKRQQWFFNALLARLKDPTVIVKLPELLKIMPQYIQTDMSAYELAKYAGIAKHVDTSTIQIATIPGTPSTRSVVSYWIIDPEKTQELIDNMVYRNKQDIELQDLSIGILYAESKEQQAQELQEKLELEGAQVTLKPTSGKKDYIAIHNLSITGETVNEIKKLIPEIKDKHTVYDPIGVNRAGKDLTVVIADL